MGESTLYAGIDLGGTNIQIALIEHDPSLVDGPFRVVAREKRKTKPLQGADAVIGRIADGVREAVIELGQDLGSVVGVGIGAPGAIDPATGSVIEAPNLRWRDEPLASKMRDALGKPVVVDNDVNVAVLGEARLGAAKGKRHVLGVWLGTGVGGGVVIDGKLHHGHFFSAGEIGRMEIEPAFPPDCRLLEHLCSRTAIADRVARMIRQGLPSTARLTELVENNVGRIKSSAIAEAYREHDALVIDVVHDAADRLGVHLAGIQTLLSLEAIVLGGGLTEAIGQPLCDRVRAAMAPRVFPKSAADVPVVMTQLRDDAGTLGAAILAVGGSTV